MTQFSFYRSIPTLSAASLADRIRIVAQLSPGDLGRLAISARIVLRIAGFVPAIFSTTSSTTASDVLRLPKSLLVASCSCSLCRVNCTSFSLLVQYCDKCYTLRPEHAARC